MFREIIAILSTILACFIFVKAKKFVTNRAKKTAVKIVTNCSIGKVYRKDGKEAFQWAKFRNIFNLGSGVEWIKSVKEIVDLRKLVIYTVILGSIFAYGYFKGQAGKPVQFNLDYEKAFKMKINGHYLVKPRNSSNMQIEDKNGNIIKTIRAKDLPDLAKNLKPIGFELKPIGILGYGASTLNSGFEAGAGVSFIRYWKWNLETFLTNRGIYLGTSRRITDHSSLGIGAGKGYKGDNRILFYYRWKF